MAPQGKDTDRLLEAIFGPSRKPPPFPKELQKFLSQLPEHLRLCLDLIYSDGLTFEEAATCIGITTPSFRHWHYRAIRLLCKYAETEGISPDQLQAANDSH